MAVPYITVERGKPGVPDSPKKIYAMAKSKGQLTFRQLAKEIAQGSTTVSDSDML
ncbi:MAG: DNA-binding protein, partial [Flavobacteriaceae bacterium]|nr:DNA-binding protein [Flavobacteriaceae bacterium]